jgi:sugar lactone lactonase YvrE
MRNDDPYIRAGIALAVVLFILYVYPGFLIPISSHFDGSCETIPLDQNAEDLRIDPTNGLVYLTYYSGGSGSTGTVMLLDPHAAEPHVRAALASEPSGFAPSGLSLYTPATGAKRLFVTSRTRLGNHSVEIFDQSPTGAFTPAESIRDSLLWSPTAIVAVGPRQFYVVNQLGFKRNPAKENVRDRLRGNRSTVVYYDGQQMKIVAGRLGLASGMALSPDGRTAYVAESSRGRITIFDRDMASGALKRTGDIRVPGAPHNITVDANGTLWVSVHPRSLAFMEVLRDPDDPEGRAPTQVLKVTPSAAPDKQVEEIYVNDGTELSAGAVVAPRGDNEFVMGSRADHKLLMCTQSDAVGAAPRESTPDF